LEKLKSASVMTNQAQIRLRDLEREANASRIVYESFLVRSREISEQKGLDTSSERILSSAVAPIAPDGLHPLFVLAFAAAFAFGVGSVLALVREQFDNTVHSAAQVTALTGLPVLATISDMTVATTAGGRAASDVQALLRSHSMPAVVYHRPNSEGAAAFRRLDGLFRNTGSALSLRTVLVTSVGQADGKSTVALNLALAAMEAGDRVLLVDGDLVNRSLTTAAAVPVAATPGLTFPIVPGDSVGLSLAMPGSLALDTGSPIDGRAMRSTIVRLAGDFDAVIIDGSAIGTSPSLAALADAASDIVVVVRAQTSVASRFIEALPVLGAVAHKVRGAVFLDL
jgi:Mrp family chromosome partitioning ATPase